MNDLEVDIDIKTGAVAYRRNGAVVVDVSDEEKREALAMLEAAMSAARRREQS
jgi:hypothetical protein